MARGGDHTDRPSDLTVPIFIPAFGVGLICGFSVLQTFEGAITTLCVCFVGLLRLSS